MPGDPTARCRAKTIIHAIDATSGAIYSLIDFHTGGTGLRADAQAYPSTYAVADAKTDHLAATYAWADASANDRAHASTDAGAIPEAVGEADASAHADPNAAAYRRALFQAHAAAHASALAFADRDSRQPHGRACVRADAAPDAATISAADNAVP